MSRSALVFLLLGELSSGRRHWKRLLTVCHFLVGCIAGVSCGVWAEKGYETIGRLQKTLMTDYNKWVIPLVDLADRVKVAVGFNVIAFEMVGRTVAFVASLVSDTNARLCNVERQGRRAVGQHLL